MRDDTDLLRRYAKFQDQAAFTELVRHRLNFVFNCALRLSGGNTALAQDATQMVFADLARGAKKLQHHPALVAWFHTATRFAVGGIIRSETRRQIRETAAVNLNVSGANETGKVDWTELKPVLDEVIGTLKERERMAILLRFFEGSSFREIATALKVTETAARSCIVRALDKMRIEFGKHGIASTAAGIAVALESQVLTAAPAAWVVGVPQASLAKASATTAAQIFVMKKVIIGIASLVIAAECVTATVQIQHRRSLRKEYREMSEQAEAQSKQDARVSSEALNSRPTTASAHRMAAQQGEIALLQARVAKLKARPSNVTDEAMQRAQNLGRKSASDAAQTLFWLMRNNDLSGIEKYVVFSDDTPENRQTFMQQFSQAIQNRYPTPEAIVVAVSFDKHLHDPPTAVQLLATEGYASGMDVVKSWVQYASGEEENSVLSFQETPSGWTLTPLSLVGKNSPPAWLASRLNPVNGNVLPPKSP